MPDELVTLYWNTKTSAFIPHRLLDEIGVPYERVRVQTRGNPEHRSEAFRKVNPNMLLPTLRLADGRTLGENGAIILTLGEVFPDTDLVPGPEEADRPAFLHWLFALTTTGHTTIRRWSYPGEYTTDPTAEEAAREAAWRQLSNFWDVLETAIQGDPWMLPRGFTALDIYVAFICLIVSPDMEELVFTARPKLEALRRATFERPGFRTLWDFYELPNSV